LTLGEPDPYVFMEGSGAMGGGYEDGSDNGEAVERWLTTGDMARLAETTLRTVRFYESEGLLVAQERADGSHRKFPDSELRKLQMIMDLREVGLSLQDIKSLMAIKARSGDAPSASEGVREAVAGRLQEVERRMAALTRVRRELKALDSMLVKCGDCHEPGYPARCSDCSVVNESGAGRATELLWKN
jgi:DNA-binding transcriptional MerR regulator